MAEVDLIKEYLIAVGVKINANQFTEFSNALRKIQSEVERSAVFMSSTYVKAGGLIAGTLASIIGATSSLLDKVSQADLGYELYAMKMFMDVDAAKKMKIALDALGHTMDEVAMHPELADRFATLMADQEEYSKLYDKDYKKNQRNIRDIAFGIDRLKVAALSIMQVLASGIAQKLGLKDLTDPLESLRKWMTNPENVDKFVDTISNALIKVKQFTEHIINMGKAVVKFDEQTHGAVKALGALLIIIGVVSSPVLLITGALIALIDLVRDYYAWLDGSKSNPTLAPIWKSLKPTIEGIGTALTETAEKMSEFYEKLKATGVDKSAKTLVGDILSATKELGTAVAQAVKAFFDPLDAFSKTDATNSILALTKALLMLGRALFIVGEAAGLALQGKFKQAKDKISIKLVDEFWEDVKDYQKGISDNSAGGKIKPRVVKSKVSASGKYSKEINEAAKKYGLDPNLIASVIDVENEPWNPNLSSPKGAMGLMQLMPATAKSYGVTNPFDPGQNIEGGAHLLSDLLKQYKGDQRKALAAYNGGTRGILDPLMETQNYIPKVEAALRERQGKGGNNISVGDISVNVDASGSTASAKDIGDKTADAIWEKLKSKMMTQNTYMQQEVGGAYR